MPDLGLFLVESPAQKMMLDRHKGEEPARTMRLRQGKQTYIAYVQGQDMGTLGSVQTGHSVKVRGIQFGEVIMTYEPCVKTV